MVVVMKKVSILLFLGALVMCWACTRSQLDRPAEASSSAISLNLTVSDWSGETKSVKTAWVTGDRINFWFDANGADQAEPDLVAYYDGSSWAAGTLREGCSLAAAGTLLALYESYNDFSPAKYSYSWESSMEWFTPIPSKESADYRCMPMVVSCENIPYTFAGNTLTATLTGWNFQTRFKVLVKNDDSGLTLSADSYVLQVHNISADTYPSVSSAWQVIPGVSCPAKGTGAGNAVGKVGGVQEADGIAFYYDSFTATSADILFTLSVYGDKVYEYAVTGKSLDSTGNNCTGVALKHSSFSPKGNIDKVTVEDWGLLN